jgi:3'(2'), 5'-bisphosphate nucleotidase
VAGSDYGNDLAGLLAPLFQLAKAAGQEILGYYGREVEVETKPDQTPLTAADLAAHEVINEGLQRLTPELPVLSEESGELPPETRRGWERFWLVDPLDGTRHFIRGDGQFCVNIALIDNCRPILGMIYAPVSGDCYSAVAGGGAKRVRGGVSESLQSRRPAVAPLTVVSGHFHDSGRHQRALARLGDYRQIRLGSALKSCLVAAGEADLYLRPGPTSEWDTAAAQCIVEEAGGAILNLKLEPLRYNCGDELLNPYFIAVGDRDYPWAERLDLGACRSWEPVGLPQ